MVLDPRISSLALCGFWFCFLWGFLCVCVCVFFFTLPAVECELAYLSSVFFNFHALSADRADTAVHRSPSC